jgi:DNA-directed RNA polymerase specialized sigma24 family protein
MFRTRQQLMDALARFEEYPGPGSISLISVERVKRAAIGEPFRAGFLTSVEQRSELLRLLRRLDERSQRLLLLWFVKDRPPAEVANDLGISRVHCYRLRNRALDEMLEPGERRRETPRAS